LKGRPFSESHSQKLASRFLRRLGHLCRSPTPGFSTLNFALTPKYTKVLSYFLYLF
jgi:hypothetical protein